MPVIGHALLGFATAALTAPEAPDVDSLDTGDQAPRAFPIAHWTLLLVLLAYLPDLIAHAAGLAGVEPARHYRIATMSHSLIFAVVAAICAAPIVSRVGGLALPAGTAIALLSLLLHDVTDVLQAAGRAPLWPFLDWTPDPGRWTLPSSLWGELFVFAPPALAASWWAARRGAALDAEHDATAWLSLGAIVLIVLAATVTSSLRDSRERDLATARELVADQDYTRVFLLLDRAEQWPSTVRPGRADYVRAEATLAMGARAQAERYYLRSHDADPSYFWTVGDLAVLYASGKGPIEERRRRSEPWVALLRTRFANHPALERTLARVAVALKP